MKKINITESDIAAVATILQQIVPDTSPRVSPGQSQPSAVKVIHCVLSARTNYDKVVVPRLETFMNNHPDTQRVVNLANLMASYPTPHAFMKQELNYNSERKARILQAVVNFVCQIVRKAPNTPEEEALKKWAIQAEPEDYRTLNIKGFALASFQYLRMLFGADTTKPDVHIKRFVSGILSREVSDIESLFLLEASSKCAGLSARAVDYFIWDRAARGTGTNVVRMAPDVAASFINEETVNATLQSLLKVNESGVIAMLTTIIGVYRGGKIEFSETPRDVYDGTPVMVTFLPSNAIDLQERGIDEAQAADIRARLASFAEDWENPEMNVYDNYDDAKSKLQTR